MIIAFFISALTGFIAALGPVIIGAACIIWGLATKPGRKREEQRRKEEQEQQNHLHARMVAEHLREMNAEEKESTE